MPSIATPLMPPPPPLRPPSRRDDSERTALHWAAEVGLSEAVPALLKAGAAAVAELIKQQKEDAEAVAAVAADEDGGGSFLAGAVLQDLPPPPALVDIPDEFGDLPLHVAARMGHTDVIAALLVSGGDSWDGAAAAAARNKQRDAPLHIATRHGRAGAAAALLAAAPAVAEARNKHGFTPAELAARRGYASLAELLRGSDLSSGGGSGAGTGGRGERAKTLVIAPPECNEHYTCPQPVTRAGPEPPPENPARLDVVLDEGKGALRAAEFEGRVEWVGSVPPAPMVDLLRVHDWSYLKTLQVIW